VDILNNTLFGRVLVIFFSVVGGGTVEKEGDRELFTQIDLEFSQLSGRFLPLEVKKSEKMAFFRSERFEKCKKYPPQTPPCTPPSHPVSFGKIAILQRFLSKSLSSSSEYTI
jgi:hypothetical protein